MLVTRKGGGGRGVEEVKGFMKMLLHDNDVFTVLFKGMKFQRTTCTYEINTFFFCIYE